MRKAPIASEAQLRTLPVAKLFSDLCQLTLGSEQSAGRKPLDTTHCNAPRAERLQSTGSTLLALLPMPSTLFFLPGALGRMDFWMPAAALIRHPAKKTHVGWPGFGPTPAEPGVGGIDALVDKVVASLDGPCALIAQSMGGIIALRVALARPDLVTHLILAETSGGIDVTGMGAQDWRPFVRNDYPALPDWFLNDHEDLTDRLHRIRMPTLLLWGDADPISPVKVGEKLAMCIPHAALHIIAGADHDLAYTHAPQVAALIDQHLL